MEHALTRILVAVAVIAAVSCAATYASHLFYSAVDAGTGDLIAQGTELCSSLYVPANGTVYGFSSGSVSVHTADLGNGNITVVVSGDTIAWSFPKSAFVIDGIIGDFPEAGSGFSVNAPLNCISEYSASGSSYMEPKVLISFNETTTPGGSTNCTISIRCCRLLPNFNASGSFDIIKETTSFEKSDYERSCLYNGSITVYIDGTLALSLNASRGESILIDSECTQSQLIAVER